MCCDCIDWGLVGQAVAEGRLRLTPVLLIIAAACGSEESPATSRVAEIDTIAEISFRGLPVPSASAPVAVNAAADRIAVALRDGSGEILIFDRGGQVVRQIGRAGAGPSEFRDISAITFARSTDSLWVMDEGNMRISVFAPDAAEPSRELPLRGRYFGTAWASDTTLVVQGQFPDGPENALARAVQPGGVKPTVVQPAMIPAEDFDESIRPLTSSAAGGVWVGHFRLPRIRRYDSSLAETANAEYTAPALEVVPRNAEMWNSLMDTRPAVLGLTEDAHGDLWFLFGIPADPLPSVEDAGRALAEGRISPADLSRTVLARYEPEDFSRPADQFEQGHLRGGLLSHGIAYYFDTDESGEKTLAVVRLGSREVR